MPEDHEPPSPPPADEPTARNMDTIKATEDDLGHWKPPTAEQNRDRFPNYEVVDTIGRGGMGVVYKARQIELQRLVAIKLLPLQGAVSEDRFRREAHVLAQLNHPNIVTVYDFGKTREGHHYYVMELVEGANLAELIRADGVDAERALEIIEAICDALQYAHSQGVVHRDIKPANVLVDVQGRVKVADFGLARLVDFDPAALGHTQTGTIMGTPDYMAPEQKRSMKVDHRADIYSLGVLLYEMFCKETPRGLSDLPSTRTGCDARIDRIVEKAMRSEPGERYQSTQEMKADVAGARRVTVAPRKPDDVPVARALPYSERSRALFWGSAGVALLVIVCFAAARYRQKPAPDSATVVAIPTPIKPALAPTPTATPFKSPTGGRIERWHDWLAEETSAGRLPAGLVPERGGYRTTQGTSLVCGPASADQALRVTYLPTEDRSDAELQIVLRSSLDFVTLYRAHASDTHWRIIRRDPPDLLTTLSSVRRTPEMRAEGARTVEFRALGETLTFLFNGHPLAAVEDPHCKAGRPRLMCQDGIILKKIEWLELVRPAKTAARASPAP